MSNPIEVLGGWKAVRAAIAEIRKSPRLASEQEVAAVCDLAIEWLNEPFPEHGRDAKDKRQPAKEGASW